MRGAGWAVLGVCAALLGGRALADAGWYEAFGRARAYIAAGRYEEAAQALPPLAGADSVAAINQWLVSKALVAELTGDLAGAVEALETQLRMVPGVDERATRLRIWGLVQRLPAPAVQSAANADVQGWLALAQVLAQPRSDRRAFVGWYRQWLDRYPEHPGRPYSERHVAALIPDYAAISRELAAVFARPAPQSQSQAPTPAAAATPDLQAEQARRHSGAARVALILPTRTSYARVVDAIRRGIAQQQGHLEIAFNRPVQVDWLPSEGSAQHAATLIEWAQASSYSAIIGPLTRAEMPALGRAQLRVPIVALNFVDDVPVHATGADVPRTNVPIAQMGLSPQDDAIAAAVDAHARGSRYALLIVASDGWSQRLAAAFTREFISRGGAIIAQAAIRADGIGAQGAVRGAVEVRGFDSVFVAARSHAAQSAVALLRYYWVYAPPIYASRTSFAASKHASHDLRGVTLCGPIEDAVAGGSARSAEALGADAAMVLAYAVTGQLRDGWQARGQTGPLWYRNSRVVRLSNCQTLPGRFGGGPRR